MDDEWGALHQGADQDGVDLPSRFDLGELVQPTRVTGSGLPGRHRRVEAPKNPARFVHRRLVRPYARTRGRTTPSTELALEALVATSDKGRRHQGTVSAEQRFICDLCVEEHSVAEVAAYSSLPLAVVKVLVEDLAAAGAVHIHQPGLIRGDRPAREFMLRVLAGLQKL